MTPFERALRFVLDVEGGFSNDPRDSGGATNFGISSPALAEAKRRRLVPDETTPETLTKDQARIVYHEMYWLPAGCGHFPEPIAIALFDSAVNQGPARAVQMLQRALRVQADGVVGPKTIAAAQQAIPHEALIQFLSWRALSYSEGQEVYRRGWFARLFRLQRALTI